ncbi:hypothetical protein [Methylobacterium tarhaniae]|uniref:hypothetical protein n=1 Tax=Methylobacterium tarhaniae TaxID=1187852 RepID=UPI000A9BA3CA|nr:hypothetical protein [Methylobacterium tarhaniae]
MTDAAAPQVSPVEQPSGIAEMARLADLLAERVLAEGLGRGSTPIAHIRALVDAAMLLEDYGQEMPPSLERMIREVREAMGTAAQINGLGEDDDGSDRLA